MAATDAVPLPGFDEFTVSLGLKPRALQAEIARQAGAALSAGQPVVLAIQAGTGTGKTWALAHPAMAAAAAGRRVVWSTHTVFQRTQVMATFRQALVTLPGAPALAERRGLADFVSPSRTRRLRYALEARGAPAATLAALDRLASRAGLLAEFERDEGSLPAASGLLCLTAACPAEEMETYRAQKLAAQDAAIVVQTHAMTLLQARFGRLEADLVVFDEADALPGVAAGAVELRLPLDDIAALAERAGADIATPLENLRLRAGPDIAWCDPAIADAARQIASGLSCAAGSLAATEPETADALADMAEDLRDFARHAAPPPEGAPRIGAALVDEAGPTLAVVSVDPARWLGAALQDKQVVLMSATLGRHDETEEEVVKGCRRLGFFGDVRPIIVSPTQYGRLRFHLAPRDTPLPFRRSDEDEREVEPEPRFYEAAAAMVAAARATGKRTLVLCASFGDVEEIAPRLGEGVLLHRRGTRLSALLPEFEASTDGVLLTPGAWAGLDVQGGIANVVILRLPLGRPDALRQEVLRRSLERRGLTERDARNILAQEARGDAMRRITQGMGRGVRDASHSSAVWIADPRFPLPASLIAEVWRGFTQGPATGWEGFALAIPRRFRQPAGRSAYDRVHIVGQDLHTAA